MVLFDVLSASHGVDSSMGRFASKKHGHEHETRIGTHCPCFAVFSVLV